MRTPTCSRPARAPRDPLSAVARAVDDAAVAVEDRHVAFHAVLDEDGFDLGLLPFPNETHPFVELAGFDAPASWAVFGLRVTGTTHHLDDGSSARSTTTYAVDRGGAEVTILREGDRRRELPSGAEGTLPDLCRRVLGLPTPPPPAPTTIAFTTAWLDRVLEAWNDPHQRRALCASFQPVAAAHPAVPDGVEAPTDPLELARLAQDHARQWSWSRLRAQPDGLDLPDGTLPTTITTWLDDGAYARWVLGSFPHLTTLAVDVVELLGPVTGEEVAAHLAAILDA